jgi:hypothetical protein
MRNRVSAARGQKAGVRSQSAGGVRFVFLLTSIFCLLAPAFAQQPQAQGGQPIYPINAKYVQGFGPGYWPTAGLQLTLNLAPGTAICSNTVQTYPGGTLTLTANTTNYVYLDAANNCAPAFNTTGFSSMNIPIAQVTTSATAITSITDVRTMFITTASGSVTSVGMTGDGVIFNTTVQGSPITASGTLAPQLLTQAANSILAGPGSGNPATPTFRALVGTDLPTPSASALGGIKSVTCGSGQFVNSISTSGGASCATPTGGGGSDYGLGNGTTVIDATLYTGTDFGSKVNAAIAALPSTGGTVDARGLGSNQNMSVSITVGANTTLLLPAGTITRASGAQIITNGGIVKGAGKNLTYLVGNDSSAAIVRSATGAAQEITGLTIQNSGQGPCIDLTYQGGGTLNVGVHDDVFRCATGLIFLGYYNRVWNNTFLPNPNGILWAGVLMDGFEIVNSNHLWDNVFNGVTGTGVFTRGGYANTFDGKPDAESIGLAYFVSGAAQHIHDLYAEGAGCSATWAPSTQYGLGAVLKDSNGHCEVATTAGTSGSGSPPTWSTNQGGSTSDNTVTWMMYDAGMLTSANAAWPGSNSLVLAPGAQNNLIDGVGNGALDLDLVVNGNFTNRIDMQGNAAWGIAGMSPHSLTAGANFGFLLGPYNDDSGYNARASLDFKGLIQGGSTTTFYGPEVDAVGAACSAGGVCGHLPFHIGLVHSSAGIQDFGSVTVNPLPTPAAPTVSYTGPSGANSYTFYLVANVAGQQTLPSTGATINNVGTLSGGNCITVQVPTTYQYTDRIRGDSFPDLWSTVRWDILLGDTAHSVATHIFVPSAGYSYCGGTTSAYSAPTRNSTGDASFGGKLTTTNNTLDDGSGNATFAGKVTAGTAGLCIGTNCVTTLTQGTVTSVGLSMPAIFSVSGSPVTSSGTLAATLVAQNAHLVFVGPSSGGAASPTFRTLVGADLPSPSASTLGGVESITCGSGQFVNQISTSGVPACATPSGGGGTWPLTSPNGAIISDNGSGGLSLAAGGTNQNVAVTPSGSGYTLLGGYVGIGTTTPQQLLHLYQTNTAAYLRVQGANDGDNFSGLELMSYEATPNIWQFVHKNNHDFDFAYYNGSSWTSPFSIQAATGNVGIGTTTPGRRLDVVGGYARSDTGFCIGSTCVTALVQPIAQTSNNWVQYIDTSGVPHLAQPAFSNLSGAISLAQTPLTTAGDLLIANSTPALARLAVGTTHQFLGNSSGLPAWVQPAFSDISGTISSSQFGSQSANRVFASPNGSSGNPSFRSLVGADLPAPTTTTLGGVQSIASANHNWISYIDTSGAPHQSQPALSDLTATFNSPLSLSTNILSCTNCVTGSSLTSGQLVIGNAGSVIQVGNLSGDVTTSGGTVTTVAKVNGVTFPASPSANQVPVVTGTNVVTYEAVPNAALANSSITLNGTANQITSPGATALGGTATFALANPLTFPGKTTHAASTASAASLNIPAGTAPTSPSTGDIWNPGISLVFYDGTANRTLAATGSCTNQAVTATSSTGVSCTTLTSSYVDTSIAKTGTDINTSNQVTATHLAAALPINQGGTGITSTLTGLVRGGASNFTAAELSGDATTSGSNLVTVGKVNGVSYPSSPSTNMVPVVTASNTVTYEAVPNAALANSSITLNGTANQISSPGLTALGGTATFSIANPFVFPGKWTGAASTTAAATLNLPSGVAPTTGLTTGDLWNLSGILQFYDGSHTQSLTTIQAAPTSGHLAIFSGTSGLLTDGGAVPTGTVTSSSLAQYNAVVATSATNIQGVAPTANGQCFMSAPSNYATTYPSFQTCPGGSGANATLSNLTGPTAINLSTLTGAGAIGLTAGGTNQNVTLTPSGTGKIVLSSLASSAFLGTDSSANIVSHTGTAGGVPYFDTTASVASSAALSQYHLVLGGTSQTFDPSSISGLVFWVKADQITGLNDGDPVATWSDQSGNSHDATQSNASYRPAYKTGILNGLPGVLFNGSSTYMITSAFALNQPSTVFIVGTHTNSGANGHFVDGEAGNTRALVGVGSAGFWGVAGTILGTSGVPSTPNIVGGIFNSTSSLLSLNGTAVTGDAGSASASGLTLGMYGTPGSNYLQGYLFEVLAYNTALSTANRQAIEGYLAWKWGLQGSLPANHPYKSAPPGLSYGPPYSLASVGTVGQVLTSAGAGHDPYWATPVQQELNTVTFSVSPTFNASLGNTQKITLTGDITSSTLSNAFAGQQLNFIICQDSSGGHAFAWPSNVKGGMTIGSTASKCSAQSFIFDGSAAYATASGVTNM